MKFSVAHPNSGKRSTENFTKISRQISRHLWQRKTEKNFTSTLLQGSCSENLRTFICKRFRANGKPIGHPQTCVYPDVCLGIAHVSGKAPLPGQGEGADTQCICPFRPKESVGRKGQIHCVCTGPLVPREGFC